MQGRAWTSKRLGSITKQLPSSPDWAIPSTNSDLPIPGAPQIKIGLFTLIARKTIGFTELALTFNTSIIVTP